jgi:hypothetical protein
MIKINISSGVQFEGEITDYKVGIMLYWSVPCIWVEVPCCVWRMYSSCLDYGLEDL